MGQYVDSTGGVTAGVNGAVRRQYGRGDGWGNGTVRRQYGRGGGWGKWGGT